jgi:hypothetical protein
MEAELGISKWAIVALVVAMVVVGTMGLALGGAPPHPVPDRTTPASAQSR